MRFDPHGAALLAPEAKQGQGEEQDEPSPHIQSYKTKRVNRRRSIHVEEHFCGITRD